MVISETRARFARFVGNQPFRAMSSRMRATSYESFVPTTGMEITRVVPAVSIDYFPATSISLSGLLPLRGVPRFTPTANDFGDWLAELRIASRVGHEDLARKFRRLLTFTGKKFHASQVVKWEQGRVPDWHSLLAMSVVYEQPIGLLVTRLVKSLNHVTSIVTPDDNLLTASGLSYATPQEKPLVPHGPLVAELAPDARTVVALLQGLPDADKAVVGHVFLDLGMALVEPDSARAAGVATRQVVRARAVKSKNRKRRASHG